LENDTQLNDAADVHLQSDVNSIHEVLVMQQVKITSIGFSVTGFMWTRCSHYDLHTHWMCIFHTKNRQIYFVDLQ